MSENVFGGARVRRWFKKGGAGRRRDPPVPLSEGDDVNRALAHLDLLEGSEGLGTRRFRVSEGQNTIGRSPDCDISLPDPAISRVHAVLIADEHSIVIEHHSQTNETFVNGAVVRDRQALGHGDRVQLGDRVLLQLDAPALKAELLGFSPGAKP